MTAGLWPDVAGASNAVRTAQSSGLMEIGESVAARSSGPRPHCIITVCEQGRTVCMCRSVEWTELHHAVRVRLAGGGKFLR